MKDDKHLSNASNNKFYPSGRILEFKIIKMLMNYISITAKLRIIPYSRGIQNIIQGKH